MSRPLSHLWKSVHLDEEKEFYDLIFQSLNYLLINLIQSDQKSAAIYGQKLACDKGRLIWGQKKHRFCNVFASSPPSKRLHHSLIILSFHFNWFITLSSLIEFQTHLVTLSSSSRFIKLLFNNISVLILPFFFYGNLELDN